MDLLFRKLKEHDLSSVVALAQHGLFPGWTDESYLSFLNQSSSVCFGGFIEGKLVSFFLGLFSAGNLDIVAIATDLEQRRKGLAKRLLSEALKPAGVLTATLEVDPQNEAAVRLYMGAGFEVAGLRKKYYEGRKDAWLMRWSR
ncbi:MAG: N-acetyltransferase [Proteobacteria bacterium]|nr:N-acetyltransferase [Pseudomonadota bacterium]NDC23506.1 N-acetyltransferase [Pseudomonadota bacterium]NDD03659.1 N-acetyltransferase [Pseudomonadota bacterium]NDG26100.1 N-acetyltransferase [Pseudomonadota bacterium]